MIVADLIRRLQVLGWDTEVVVRMGEVEYEMTDVLEAVTPKSRAVLVAHPEPHPDGNSRRTTRWTFPET